jgi:hypothetical protein
MKTRRAELVRIMTLRNPKSSYFNIPKTLRAILCGLTNTTLPLKGPVRW